MLLETILAEMAIESEYLVESAVVNQREAGAIDIAKVFVVVPREYDLRRPFNRVTDPKDPDTGAINTAHKINSRSVTDSEAYQAICFRENEVGR